MHVEPRISLVDKEKRVEGGPSDYTTCELHLEIPGLCDESSEGDGLTISVATEAAWLHMLSKMHVSGALSRLFEPSLRDKTKQHIEKSVDSMSPPQTEVTCARSILTPSREPPRLFDIDHIVAELTLPTKAEYFNAVSVL